MLFLGVKVQLVEDDAGFMVHIRHHCAHQHEGGGKALLSGDTGNQVESGSCGR
jgi:hypothetical protein